MQAAEASWKGRWLAAHRCCAAGRGRSPGLVLPGYVLPRAAAVPVPPATQLALLGQPHRAVHHGAAEWVCVAVGAVVRGAGGGRNRVSMDRLGGEAQRPAVGTCSCWPPSWQPAPLT